jgi:hypothetical protein
MGQRKFITLLRGAAGSTRCVMQNRAALFIFAILCACFIREQALAKDRSQWADSPHHDWYKNQRNGFGRQCCDNSDAHPYFGNYTLNNDGSVTLSLDGGDYTIPKMMVIDGPNPTGHAVWWFADQEGYHMDFCFAVGSLS